MCTFYKLIANIIRAGRCMGMVISGICDFVCLVCVCIRALKEKQETSAVADKPAQRHVCEIFAFEL